jgi:hypothetical protein
VLTKTNSYIPQLKLEFTQDCVILSTIAAMNVASNFAERKSAQKTGLVVIGAVWSEITD